MNQIIRALFWRPVILKQKYLITSSTKLLIPQHPVNSSLITELVISLQTRELTARLQCRAISEIQRIFSAQKWRPPYTISLSIPSQHHPTTHSSAAMCLWEPSGLKQLSRELVLQHSSSRSSTEQTHLRHNSAPVSPTAAPTPRVQCSHFASPMSMLPPVSHFKKTHLTVPLHYCTAQSPGSSG